MVNRFKGIGATYADFIDPRFKTLSQFEKEKQEEFKNKRLESLLGTGKMGQNPFEGFSDRVGNIFSLKKGKDFIEDIKQLEGIALKEDRSLNRPPSLGEQIENLGTTVERRKSDLTTDVRDVQPSGALSSPGILGLQEQIDQTNLQAQKNILKDKLTDLPSLPEGIGVAPPSFRTEDVPKDFETIERSLPGDFESLKEEREPTITDKEVLGGKSNEQSAEDLLINSLNELYGPQEQLTGEERTKAMEQYKKDFYEATGLDSSGKPDMKDAMVAFGLALMQNKAGKKLDIGKIFGEVGKAGQVALPLASEARKQAESRKIAAGQFALGELGKEDERRRQSKIKQQETERSLIVDRITRNRDLAYKLLEAQQTGNKEEIEKLLNLTAKDFTIAGDPIKINRGTDPTDGRRVYVDPQADIVPISNALARTEAGLNLIDDAMFLVEDIKNVGDKKSGGTAAYLTKSKLTSLVEVLGIDAKNVFGQGSVDDLYIKDEKTGELKLKTQKLKAIQRGLIARFKRFLTQETGNGISNVDVQRLEDLTASLDNVFTNPNQALANLQQVKGMFIESKTALDNVMNGFLRRDQYKAGEVGQKEYENVLKIIDTDLEKFFGSVEVSTKDGQLFYDLTKDA